MNLYNRKKIFLLFRVVSTLFICLLVLLYLKQIKNHNLFTLLAEKNFTRIYPIDPLRGCIFDRNGIPLTQNRFVFRAIYLPGAAAYSSALGIIQKCLPSSDVHTARAHLHKKAFFTIKNGLTTDELVCLRQNNHEKCGVAIERTIVRHHPHGPTLGRVLGQTGCPLQDAILNKDAFLRYLKQPAALAGLSGCESIYDTILSGKSGLRFLKVNAQGKLICETSKIPPQHGRHLRLTLNAPLQSYISGLLCAVRAAHAVVLHIPTGQVLAMASHDHNDYATLGASNKVISGLFAPGSIFKIITALTTLIHHEENFVTNCQGTMQLGNRTFHCWRKQGHGQTDLSKALYTSCNIFFYKIALKLGAEKIIATAKKLGLGSLTGIDLTSEAAGIMPPHDPQTGKPYRPWYPADTAILGIGQGRITTTPLQLAHMLASIIRGYATPPYLNYDKSPSYKEPLKFSKKIRAQLINILHKCIHKPGGTAYTSTRSLNMKETTMAGKTSTSQVRSIIKGVSFKNLPWELRHHSMFVGVAPHDKPIIAISVIGEHELWGAGFAAKAAFQAADYALSLHAREQLLAVSSPEVSLDPLSIH